MIPAGRRGLTVTMVKKAPFMQTHLFEKQYPFDLNLVCRRGLGRTLLLCVLGLGLLPMALVGVISYQTVDTLLDQDVRNTIRMAADLKHHQLPGEGHLPLEPFLHQLVGLGYDGPITLELSPVSLGIWWPPAVRRNLARSVAYIRDCLVSAPSR